MFGDFTRCILMTLLNVLIGQWEASLPLLSQSEPSMGRDCHDREQEVTRGRRKNAFIEKNVSFEWWSLYPVPQEETLCTCYNSLYCGDNEGRIVWYFVNLNRFQLRSTAFYDLTIWHSLCNWIRNHLTPAAANITILSLGLIKSLHVVSLSLENKTQYFRFRQFYKVR